jgi:drug/metabolite transporter (DMT)-like permease
MTLILRGILGVTTLSCWYSGLRMLYLSEASTIFLMSPIFTVLLGAIVLKEKIGKTEIFCCILSFVGIIFISKP